MNLQSKKARVPVAALGVTALICGAGALTGPAFADTTNPSEPTIGFSLPATSATVLSTNPSTSVATSGLAYGLKLTGEGSSTAPLRVENLSSSGGALVVLHAQGNGASGVTTTLGATTLASTTVQLVSTTGIAVGDTVTFAVGTVETRTVMSVTNSTHIVVDSATATDHTIGSTVTISTPSVTAAFGASTVIPSYSAGDRLYLGDATAGTYTLRFFRDENASGNYDGGDHTSPTFTLTVKDPSSAGVFDLAVPTSLDSGTTGAKTTVTTSLSTTDIRGTAGTPAVGVLGSNIAALLTHDFTDGAQVTNGPADGVSSFDGTHFFHYLSTSAGADALGRTGTTTNTIGTQLVFNGGADFPVAPKVTTITTNGVTSLTLAVKSGQTADVTGTGTGVLVRAGKDTVTYTATATDGTDGLAGKTVVFTFAPGAFVGTTLSDLTANGAAIPSTGDSANTVSATTDANGVATLIVKSAKTADSNAYRFTAGSGSASDGPILATYRTAAATTFTTSGGTSQTVGGSVTLKGKVLDQWLQGINTGGQATLSVTRGGGIGSDITRGVDVQSDGTFSTAVADATSNTTPHNDAYTWTGVGTGPSGQGIYWVTSLSVGAATFTGLGANAVFPVPATFTPSLATPTSIGAINLTGTLKDGSGNAVPYAPFVLSGTSGVLFQTDDGGLSTTLTGTANASGLISDGTHAYVPVVLTSAGATTITLKSGTATATTGPFTTADPTVAWKVSVNDAASQPGSTIILTGKITDLFGNGVPNYGALLDLGSSTLGALGQTAVTTNDAGVFSTTFISGSNQNGVATLTATLETTNNSGIARTTDPLIGVGTYDTTGLKVDAHGEYQDQAKITVAPIKLTLSAVAHVTAGAHGGDAKLSGKFMPGTSVDIYGKESGDLSYSLVDSVTTDGEGDWGTSVHIVKSTHFLAKAQGLSSTSDETVLYSKVSMTAKAMGHGKVKLSANGDPNTKAQLAFYRLVSGKDPLLASGTSSSTGTGTVVVKLPKGQRKVYAVYKAPGTNTGTSAIVSIKVK